jgi:hypothetical protein
MSINISCWRRISCNLLAPPRMRCRRAHSANPRSCAVLAWPFLRWGAAASWGCARAMYVHSVRAQQHNPIGTADSPSRQPHSGDVPKDLILILEPAKQAAAARKHVKCCIHVYSTGGPAFLTAKTRWPGLTSGQHQLPIQKKKGDIARRRKVTFHLLDRLWHR